MSRVDDKIIIDALTCGVVGEKSDNIQRNSNRRFGLLGLSGCENSAEKRRAVLRKWLPERLSTSSFIRILNTFVTIDELNKAVERYEKEDLSQFRLFCLFALPPLLPLVLILFMPIEPTGSLSREL